MKAVKIGGGILLALVILFVVIGFALPSEVHVERDIVIEAPPEAVFAQVNSFENFNKWSPWFKRDPDTKYEFEGPESGVGSRMSWESDQSDVGVGSQEIIESRENEWVKSKLDFGEQGDGTAYFELVKVDAGTKVTWGMDTDMGSNPIGRWMGLMMDDWIGSDYEQGLKDLKKLVESEA